ncbi:MAG TPA: hypothetical protein PLI77_06225 [Bacteroidales bacterium]|jgi:hypothetical protein|nr:hypothetical protein [Bacteroidales bacterium]HPE40668.1 hypothetical protein [Bacteroidales bacterium]
MKSKINKIAGLLFTSFVMITLFTSCTDDNSNDNNISKIVSEGKWSVTNFQEDGVDQTDHFSGYNFTFQDDGTIIATNGTTTHTGTWSKGTDDSTPKFYITFSTTSGPFEEITEDWAILSYSSSKIDLKHVSGGDGSVDLLVFTKM